MKIYEIEFNKYEDETHVFGRKGECLTIGIDRPTLITEEMIAWIKDYGNGIKILKYAGDMVELKIYKEE